MALTQYVTATTLDGYIADPDNSLDWLFVVEREDEGAGFARFLEDVGAMAMGATTYEWILDHEQLLDHPERWQAMYADRPTWVFGHRELEPIPGVDLRFVQGDVVAVHTEMVEAAGDRNIWVIGGGDLVGQFHDAGLLDEVRVSITPVTLGAGAPLLPRRIEGLRLTSVERNGQMIEASYDVVRSGETG
jgi:dihydrofolate reductase